MSCPCGTELVCPNCNACVLDEEGSNPPSKVALEIAFSVENLERVVRLFRNNNPHLTLHPRGPSRPVTLTDFNTFEEHLKVRFPKLSLSWYCGSSSLGQFLFNSMVKTQHDFEELGSGKEWKAEWILDKFQDPKGVAATIPHRRLVGLGLGLESLESEMLRFGIDDSLFSIRVTGLLSE